MESGRGQVLSLRQGDARHSLQVRRGSFLAYHSFPFRFTDSLLLPSPLQSFSYVLRHVPRPQEECLPAESTFHEQVSTDPAKRWKSYPIVMEQLKEKARALGLWNLFLSKEHYPDVGVPLTNLEYSVMAEIMGRCPRIAPEACNCSAPDTGNMGSSFLHLHYPLISGAIR